MRRTFLTRFFIFTFATLFLTQSRIAWANQPRGCPSLFLELVSERLRVNLDSRPRSTSTLDADPFVGFAHPPLEQRPFGLAYWLLRSEKPFTTEWVLSNPTGRPPLTEKERGDLFGSFLELVASNPSNVSNDILIEKLNGWVKSPDHAIFLIENRVRFDSRGEEFLENLKKTNRHFADMQLSKDVRGVQSPITFSFDIEQQGDVFTWMFLPKDVSESDWLKLTPEERVAAFSKVVNFISTNQVGPSSLHPAFIGAPSAEGNNIFEVKHRSFELSMDRMLSQVAQICHLKKNNHSVHVHIVGEFPREYEHLPKLRDWHRMRDLHLMFLGMEGNPSLMPSTYQNFSSEPIHNPQITETDHLSIRNKFGTLGLRGSYPGATKVSFGRAQLGIELRDSTRDPVQLKKYTQSLANDWRDRPWEKQSQTEFSNFGKSPKNIQNLNSTFELIYRLAGVGLAPSITEGHAMPYTDFKEFKMFDPRTGRWHRPNAAQLERVRQATVRYGERLKQLEKSIKNDVNFRSDGDLSALNIALNEELATWAKEAKISEWFPPL